jgi:hypothetical protein
MLASRCELFDVGKQAKKKDTGYSQKRIKDDNVAARGQGLSRELLNTLLMARLDMG